MNCVHHWVIEMPQGPTSEGRCKLCGAERADFRNWVDDYYNSDLNSQPQAQVLRKKGKIVALK